MKRNYYIFSNSIIRRKDNTVVFETGDWESLKTFDEKAASDLDSSDYEGKVEKFKKEQEELLLSYDIKDKFDGESSKKFVPVEDIEALYSFGEVRFNSRFLNFLSSQKIPMHIFNYYGFYSGSYMPREYLNSGNLLVKQVEHYSSPDKRINLAKEFIHSAAFNILKNLKYYNNRECGLNDEITKIDGLCMQIDHTSDIQSLMGIEGNIRMTYYSSWNKIIKEDISFEKRVKKPPDNMINTLISFGNMMCYTACLSEIYRTQLNPLISYLHEPGERRFSLSLDIAEIFKPIFVDRVIFKIINQRMVNEHDFDKKLNYCYMKESARKVFTKEFDEKLKTVIYHRKLGRNVSYRRLIRLECYKLIKHIIEGKTYEGFKIWW
ncbi:MAG: type I-B CRISPR-associated endonuclease Cas1 [Ignavibacteriae bacterium]|nr:MAG: type I-B CRISPR-associated endonuclease Cas1 [Ignavibacteriota bacterium]